MMREFQAEEEERVQRGGTPLESTTTINYD